LIEVASNEIGPLRRALCAAAAGVGFFAGYVMVAGAPPGFPPTSATHWIAFLTIPAVLSAAVTPWGLWRALSRN